MAALLPEGPDGTDGTYDAKCIEAGFRWGMARLTTAADDVLDHALVAAVCTAAWDLHQKFDARGIDGFREVEDLAISANSWTWSDAMLYDPASRQALYAHRTAQAYSYARARFPRLKQEGWDIGVNKAFERICRVWLEVPNTYVRLPGWVVRPVMKQYLHYGLLDAAAEIDKGKTAMNGTCFVSLGDVIELGERGVMRIDGYETDDEDLGVDSSRWHLAAVSLSQQSESKVAAVRKGASRQKAELTYRAATHTLERGAEHAEVRAIYDQDPLLCCYRSLNEVAVGTWSDYPLNKVPTRDVLLRVAAETAAQRRANAGWFKSVEARRKELNERGRLLHDINDLVRDALDSVEVGG